MRIWLVDSQLTEDLADAYAMLANRLQSAGVDVSWGKSMPPEVGGNDRVILQHSIQVPVGDWIVLGWNSINRFERLAALGAGAPGVPRYASPNTLEEAGLLFDYWGVTEILFKADSSFRRRGVRLWRQGQAEPIAPGQYSPRADLFMERVLSSNEADSRTYKLDLFCEYPVGFRTLNTLPVDHPEFQKDGLTSSLAAMPDWAASIGRIYSGALRAFGVGYWSADFMLSEGGYRLIEVNANSVGRIVTWITWPETYVENYAAALVQWVRVGAPGVSLATAQRNAKALRERLTCR